MLTIGITGDGKMAIMTSTPTDPAQSNPSSETNSSEPETKWIDENGARVELVRNKLTGKFITRALYEHSKETDVMMADLERRLKRRVF
jgi:hypothetical protein